MQDQSTLIHLEYLSGRTFDEVGEEARAVGFAIAAGPNGEARFAVRGKLYAPEEISALVRDCASMAPIALTGERMAALVPGAQMKVYEGAPHGLYVTHMDRLNADLLAFARA